MKKKLLSAYQASILNSNYSFHLADFEVDLEGAHRADLPMNYTSVWEDGLAIVGCPFVGTGAQASGRPRQWLRVSRCIRSSKHGIGNFLLCQKPPRPQHHNEVWKRLDCPGALHRDRDTHGGP